MAWSRVQTASGSNNGSLTLAVAFTTASVTAGNKIIAAVAVERRQQPRYHQRQGRRREHVD